MTPAASSDEEDDVPATAVKQRGKERADEHHGVMTKQRREKERAESCPDGPTTGYSSSAAVYSGEDGNDEFWCSGARGNRRVGSGDAQGDNQYISTVNLDMDHWLRRIWIWTRRCPSVLRWQNGVGERKRKGHVALHFASSCSALPRTRARAWTR